MGKSITI